MVTQFMDAYAHFSNLFYAQYEMNAVYFLRNVLFCFHLYRTSLTLTTMMMMMMIPLKTMVITLFNL